MEKVKVDNIEYEVSSQQIDKLKLLLKDYKKTSIVEFQSFDLVQIIIEGLVYELTKKTLFDYRKKIFDIINNGK